MGYLLVFMIVASAVLATIGSDQESVKGRKFIKTSMFGGKKEYVDENGVLLYPPTPRSAEELFFQESLISKLRAKRRFNSLRTSLASSSDFQVRYVHLAYTQKPNEMVVQWHTFDYDEKQLGKPIVKLAKSEQELSSAPILNHVGSQTSLYGEASVTGFDHAVLLTNLTYDTTYYYQAGFAYFTNGVPTITVQSKVYHFTTRSEDPEEVSVVMFGDMGILFSLANIGQISEVVKQNEGNGNFFIYHVGDISYADDYLGFMYQYVWDKFFEHWEDIHPYVPYMVLVGNHEHAPRRGPDM